MTVMDQYSPEQPYQQDNAYYTNTRTVNVPRVGNNLVNGQKFTVQGSNATYVLGLVNDTTLENVSVNGNPNVYANFQLLYL